MKRKLVLFIVFCVLSCSMLFAGWTVDPATLPVKSKNFVSSTFPDAQIWKAERDDGKFEVKLSNGVSIDFLPAGDWIKIDSEYTAIPMNILPGSVANSIKSKYSDASVIEVEKRFGNFKIKLNNFMEIYMSSNGQIISQEWDD